MKISIFDPLRVEKFSKQMKNRCSYINGFVKEAETAFAELFVYTCKFVLGENLFNSSTSTLFITFSANSRQGIQNYGQSATLTRMSIANNQQQSQQQNQQQSQQNFNWDSNRKK